LTANRPSAKTTTGHETHDRRREGGRWPGAGVTRHSGPR
jgi:hypothetical protein